MAGGDAEELWWPLVLFCQVSKKVLGATVLLQLPKADWIRESCHTWTTLKVKACFIRKPMRMR